MTGIVRRALRRLFGAAVLALAAAALLRGGALDGIREAAPAAIEAIREAAPAAVEAARERCVQAWNGLCAVLTAADGTSGEAGDTVDAAGGSADETPIEANETSDGARCVSAEAGEADESLSPAFSPAGSAADGESEDLAEKAGANGEAREDQAGDVPILRKNADEPTKLALTFDDGPHPTNTEKILDLLEKYGVKATFFVIGENAAARPELIERELAAGHEVQNHTMTHPALSKLEYREALDEVMNAEHAIFPEGEGRSTLLRPPCGAVSQTTLRLADRLGLSVVLWSVDTRDWEHKSAAEIVKTVRSGVSGGDVILFHDFVSGRSHTLEALETLIPELMSEGYEFVTVSELFGIEQAQSHG